MKSPARALLEEIQQLGGRLVLRADGILIDPHELLTPERAARIRAAARELVALLRAGGISSSQCERRIFRDRPDQLIVRFCCESSHTHAPTDGEVLFDVKECRLLCAWAGRATQLTLSTTLRDAVLETKRIFGGRIDEETLNQPRGRERPPSVGPDHEARHIPTKSEASQARAVNADEAIL